MSLTSLCISVQGELQFFLVSMAEPSVQAHILFGHLTRLAAERSIVSVAPESYYTPPGLVPRVLAEMGLLVALEG